MLRVMSFESIVFAFCLSFALLTPAWSTTYDPAASFEQGFLSHSNPNGVWSYGHSTGFMGPVSLYTQTSQPGVNGPNAQYWSSASPVTATSSVEFNNGQAYDNGNIDFVANQLVLVPFGGQNANLVFTAPAAGTYSIGATFRGDQNGIGVVVGVVANGQLLLSSGISAWTQTVPYNGTVSLQAGATVVFSASEGAGLQNTGIAATVTGPILPVPTITSGGIVPLNSTAGTIQPGEWVSIFGANFASSALVWNGNFPTSLGGTSVTINGKSAFLTLVSPTQINLQAPSDSATGPVSVVVATESGSATETVILAQFAPAFLLLDSKHVAGIIPRSNGSGAYGGGAYDILGPTGTSLGYPTVAAKAGDTIEVFATGLGPTSPAVAAGQVFSGAAAAVYPIALLINNVNVATAFAGLTGAGLFQVNVTVPSGLGTGDVPLVAAVATMGGAQTPPNVVISLQ